MGLTEIIINKSEELVKQRIAENTAREQKSRQSHKENIIASKKRDEVFRSQVWGAREKAQEVHNRRFEPLQNILETPLQENDSSLKDILANLRDQLSPRSPILVADRYESSYDSEHTWDNSYYRGLFMVNNDVHGNTKGVLSVCAIAKESKKSFLRPSKTEYSVAINYEYGGLIKEADKPTDFAAIIIESKTVNDFQYVTENNDIINISSDTQGNPRVEFASHYRTSPSLKKIEISEKDRIKLDNSSKMVDAIKERLIEQVSSIRQEQLS